MVTRMGLAHSHQTGSYALGRPCVITRLAMTSSLDRPARGDEAVRIIINLSDSSRRPAYRHFVGHVYFTQTPQSSPLRGTHLHHPDAPRVATLRGASTSLGRLARRHCGTRLYFTRTPRASSLRATHPHHPDAPRVATLRDASTSLGRLARRHCSTRLYFTRMPRASSLRGTRLHHPDAPHVATLRDASTSLGRLASVGHLITTRPLRASSIGWSPHDHSVTPRHSFYNLINDCYSFYMLSIPQWVT